MKAEKFSLLFGGNSHERAIARTVVAYCDGKTIKTHSGEIIGTIVATPRGPGDFQWDCVFQPHDSDKTFAEMGEEQKNKISMRRLALDALAAHLKGIL